MKRCQFRGPAVVTLALAAAMAAQACPRSADRALTGASLGQQMVVNGLPVEVQQVSTREGVEQVAGRVEKTWREAGFDVRRQAVGAWVVVSARSQDCLSTLQLKEQGGTVGFFAIGQPDKLKPALVKAPVPLPLGAHVVSTVSAKDGPRASATLTITAKRSVIDLKNHFVRNLGEAGWGDVRSHTLARQGSMNKAEVVRAQRGNELVQIVIFQGQATTAVVNHSEAL